MKTLNDVEFEAGLTALFGTYIPCEELESLLINTETPESILIAKSFLNSISNDAKMALDLLASINESKFFSKNGTMKKMAIKHLLRNKLNWSHKRVFLVIDELKELLHSF